MKFNFIKNRKIAFCISAAIILAGIISLILQGFNWDIDFLGGTEMEFALGTEASREEQENIENAIESELSIEVSTILNSGTENIIVKTKSEEYVYQFDMQLNKLTAEMQADGRIALKDDKSGETVYVIDMPYMFDANGEYSNVVTYTLEQIKNKEYRITVTANAEWMNDEERAFPVTIDPPVRIPVASMQNTFTDEDNYDTNYGSEDYCKVGYSDGWLYYTYWKSDFLPYVPTDCVIEKAILSMYHYAYTSESAQTYIGVYEPDSTWSESTLNWENQPDMLSVLADYQKLSSETVNNMISWDITRIAQKWYYGGANNGIALKAFDYNDEYDGSVEFYSDDSSTVVPRFSLVYRNAVGIEDYYTYNTQSVGRAGSGYINDYTSDLTFVHTDVISDSTIFPFSISHVYNDAYRGLDFSVNDADSTVFYNVPNFSKMKTGYGWKLNIQESVVQADICLDPNYGGYCYVYTDGDGTQHYFYADDTTEGYIDEDGLGLNLIVDSSNSISIKDKQDNKIIVSVTAGLCRFVTDHIQRTPSIPFTASLW